MTESPENAAMLPLQGQRETFAQAMGTRGLSMAQSQAAAGVTRQTAVAWSNGRGPTGSAVLARIEYLRACREALAERRERGEARLPEVERQRQQIEAVATEARGAQQYRVALDAYMYLHKHAIEVDEDGVGLSDDLSDAAAQDILDGMAVETTGESVGGGE